MNRIMAVVVLAALAVSPTAGRQASLEEVLARTAAYHAAYVQKVSGVSMDEQVQLLDVTGGKSRGVIRISSDVVLAGLQGQVIALRDPYAVDTQPLRKKRVSNQQTYGSPGDTQSEGLGTGVELPRQGSGAFHPRHPAQGE